MNQFCVEEGQNGIGKIYFACTNELIFLQKKTNTLKIRKNNYADLVMST